jgi:hypothetical protein
LEVEVRRWKKQLHRRKQAREHSHQSPDAGRKGERAHDSIVVFEGFYIHRLFHFLVSESPPLAAPGGGAGVVSAPPRFSSG